MMGRRWTARTKCRCAHKADHSRCRVVLIFAVFAVLMACANQTTVTPEPVRSETPVDGGAENAEGSDNARIAAMLVGTLTQLPGFEPLSFTVQITPAVTDFGFAVVREIRRSGYGIQRVAEDHGRNYVSYARTEIISDTGFLVEYSLTVRDVVVYRQFALTEDLISPVSPVVVVGVTPQHIYLNQDPFLPANGAANFPAGVVFELDDGQRVSYSLHNSVGGRLSTRARNVSSLIELNTAETIDINSYVSVSEAVVEFPTEDSRFLGKENKQLLRNVVNGFIPRDDLFTLSGCFPAGGRNDSPDLLHGQSLLRQKRVKEELISVGVSKRKIRISACSGSADREQIPPRSVLLTLRRLKSAREVTPAKSEP